MSENVKESENVNESENINSITGDLLRINPFAGRPSHQEGYFPPSLKEAVGKKHILKRDVSILEDCIRDTTNYFSITVGPPQFLGFIFFN